MIKLKHVEQVFLYASRFESFVTAVFVLKNHYQKDGYRTDKVLYKNILEELKKAGKEAGLKGYEIPRAFYIESRPFDTDNGLLTPALKIKRPAC